MTEETSSVDELKAQEKEVKIVIEEEDVAEEGKKKEPDVSDALRDLGRQFAETMQAAWNSQERRELESEVREGVQYFSEEVQRVFKDAKESPAAKRVKEEAEEVKVRVESGEATQKARSGFVEGLHWLSRELEKLAQQFSPPQKEPAGDEAEAAEEEAAATDTTAGDA